LDGQEKSVRGELPQVEKIVRRFKPEFADRGLGDAESEKVWQIRRDFSFSLRATGLTKLNQDIVVPRGRLAELFAFAARLQRKSGLQLACFGHAGDGNIHTNIMVDFEKPRAQERSDEALDELFRWVLAHDGAITGEHGIGLAKKRWWPLAVSKDVQDVHGEIKHLLDPNGILNPGKFV
jgi:FAD/FMN-containing dehydrogenase